MRCDWLPKQARWSHLTCSGLPAIFRKQNFSKSHIINPLLTKFAPSRWLDIGLVRSINTQKELPQYPAILTSHLVNNPYILVTMCWFCYIIWLIYNFLCNIYLAILLYLCSGEWKHIYFCGCIIRMREKKQCRNKWKSIQSWGRTLH